MSSGGGKKTVVGATAAAAVATTSVAPVIGTVRNISSLKSGNPSGNIKLLIDKTKIDIPSVSNQQQTFRINENVVPSQLISTTVSGTTSTNTVSSTPARDLTDGKMRVKVTGDETGRNGATPPASGAGQQMKIHKIIMPGRRRSVHHTVVSKMQDADVSISQSKAQTYATSDDTRLGRVKLSNTENSSSIQAMAIDQKQLTVQHVPMVVKISTVNGSAVAIVKSSQIGVEHNAKASVVSTGPVSIVRSDESSASKNKPNDIFVPPVSSCSTAPTNDVSSTKDSSSTATLPAVTATIATIGAFESTESTQNSVTMATLVNASAEKQAGITTDAPITASNDIKNASTTSLVQASGGAEESLFLPKLSRDLKQLQKTQSKSKVLTEFITEASRDGKLRMRRSGSAVGGRSSATEPSPPMQRERRRSRTATRANADFVSSWSDVDLSNDLSPPAASGRKMRSAKSEYLLSKKKPAGSQESYSSKEEDHCGDMESDGVSFAEPNAEFGELNESIERFLPSDPPKPGSDPFCWRCKRKGADTSCSECSRSFHKKCQRNNVTDAPCTDCKTTEHIQTDLKSFNECLAFVLDMLERNDEFVQHFKPLNTSAMTYYDKFIINHVDLTVIRERVSKQYYKSTEQFLAEFRLLIHNMTIYPGCATLLKHVRAMQKICKLEVQEIDPCHECYKKAHTFEPEWFIKPCSKPHLLVWAKVKGFPYWPAKLLECSTTNQAHVRFFGEPHDRAWVPVKECYLFSQRDVNQLKNKKQPQMGLAVSLKEIELHIQQLRKRFGVFNYGKFAEKLDIQGVQEQLQAMLPGALVKPTMKMNIIKVADGTFTAEFAPEPASEHSQTNPKLNEARDTNKRNASKPQSEEDPLVESEPTPPKNRKLSQRASRLISFSDKLSPVAVSTANSAPPASNAEEPAKSSNGTASAGNEEPIPPLIVRRKSPPAWEMEPLSKRRKSTAALVPSLTTQEKSTAFATTNAKEVVIPPTLALTPSRESSPQVTIAVTRSAEDSIACTTGSTTTSVQSCSSAEQTDNLMLPSSISSNDETSIQPSLHASKSIVANTVQNTTSQETAPTMNNAKQSLLTMLEIKEENISDNDEVQITPTPPPPAPSSSSEPSHTGGGNRSGTHVAPETAAINTLSKTPSATTGSSTVTVEPSNQRAKKSFPGGGTAAKLSAASVVTTSNVGGIAKQIQPIVNIHSPARSSVISSGRTHTDTPLQYSLPVSNVAHHPATTCAMVVNPSPAMPSTVTKGWVANANSRVFSTSNGTVSVSKDFAPSATSITNEAAAHDAGRKENGRNCSTTIGSDDVVLIEEEEEPVTAVVQPPRPIPPLLSPTNQSTVMQLDDRLPQLVPKPLEGIHLPDASIVIVPQLEYRTSELLNESTNKLAEYCRTALEDILSDVAKNGSLPAQVRTLELNIERLQQQHARELEELKKQYEQKLSDQLLQHVREKERAVHKTKLYQWCKKCYKEASFYCCWNTSYCDVRCQERDWPVHKASCMQQQAANETMRTTSTVQLISTAGVAFGSSPESVRKRSGTASGSPAGVLSLSSLTRPTDAAGHGMTVPNSRELQAVTSAVSLSPSTSAAGVSSARLYPSGTLGGRVTYKTPIIKSVHGGGDSIIANFPQQLHTVSKMVPDVMSPSVASATSLLVNNIGMATAPQYQHQPQQQHHQQQQSNQQRRGTTHGGRTQSSRPESRDNAYGKGIVSRHTKDVLSATTIISPPFRSSGKGTLQAAPSSSPSITMVPTYTPIITSTSTDTAGNSATAASVWNQIAMQSSSSSSSSSLSSSSLSPGGAAVSANGKAKMYPIGSMRNVPNRSTAAVLVQQPQHQHQQQLQQQPQQHQQQGSTRPMVRNQR